ncbi:MAG: hypothetical protein RLY75_812, partial [Pseudomonadota bacterium]
RSRGAHEHVPPSLAPHDTCRGPTNHELHPIPRDGHIESAVGAPIGEDRDASRRVQRERRLEVGSQSETARLHGSSR